MAKPRKCRDVVCLAFLVVVWIGWLVMVWAAMTEGCPDNCNDPKKLVFSTDSVTGEVCGTGAQRGKYRVYFPHPADPLSRRLCVSSCPDSYSDSIPASVAMGLYEGDPAAISSTRVHNCLLPSSPSPSSSASSQQGNAPRAGCFYPTYATIDIMFKCVPMLPRNLTHTEALGFSASQEAFTSAARFIAAPVGLLGSVVSELQVTWRIILWACAGAVVLAFLWLVLLRSFALLLIVSFSLLLLLASGGLTLLAWDKAGMIAVTGVSADLNDGLDSVELSPAIAKVIAVILSFATLLLLLLACCFAKRILVAVRLIQEAAKAVIDIPSIIFFPLSTLLSLILLCVLAVSGGLFLASAGEYDPVLGSYSYASSSFLRSSNCADTVVSKNPLEIPNSGGEAYTMSMPEAERFCVVYDGEADAALEGWRLSVEARVRAAGTTNFNATALASGPASRTVQDWFGGGFRQDLPFMVSDYYKFMWLYHIFSMLWTYCFTTCCLSMVIGGAIGHWYYRGDAAPVHGFPVWRSFKRLMAFQLGTAAFGSLILAVVWFARLIIQYAAKKLRRVPIPAAGAAACIVECCLKCLERFIQFVNRNALLVASVHGEAYCWSARKAFSLLLANVLRVATVSTTSFLLLLLGRLFVVATAIAATWAYVRYDPFNEHLNLASTTPIATLVVVGVLAWVIGRLFMNIYWVVIEAVLLCYFEDSDTTYPLHVTQTIGGRFVDGKILEDKPDRDARDRAKRRV